jgi:hypothetical protein
MSELGPITGQEKLVDVFGYWPSFHDAEVLEMKLARGTLDPAKDTEWGAWMECKFLVFDVVKSAPQSRVAHLIELRFNGVSEFKASDFNQQNAIYGLQIEHRGHGEFNVKVPGAYGLSADFQCESVEVLTVCECKE